MQSGLFPEWLNRYKYHLRMRNYSPKTISSYEQGIRYFGYYVWLIRHVEQNNLINYWNDHSRLRLDTDVYIEPRIINEYLSFLSSLKTYSAKTLHRLISTLSSFYRYLYSQGAVSQNPIMGIERPKVKGQEIRYLKHSQVLRLIESIEDDRDRLIVRTIYATGVRVSELCNIKIDDVDFEEQTIRICGKGDKIRTVFIDPDTLSELMKFIGMRYSGPVFLGQQDHPLTSRTVQLIFKRHAPPGITPHKIRHSYASELYRRSKNLKVVQENLGHTSIKTTEVYLHTDLDERKRVYREFFPLSEKKEVT